MFFFLWFFVSFTRSYDDLPFEDDIEEIPNDPEAEKDANAGQSQGIKKSDRQRKSLREVIGVREYIFMGIFAVYFLVFTRGKSKINQMVSTIYNGFARSMNSSFAFVAPNFKRKTNNIYELYISGRTSYVGALISIEFKKMLDIPGIVIDTIRKKRNKFSCEFILDAKDVHALINFTRLTDKNREEVNKIYGKMASFESNDSSYSIHSDVDKLTEQFVDLFNEFNEKKRGLMTLCELSDMNKFALKDCGDVVAKFEFEFDDASEIDEEVADFVVQMADAFILLQRQTQLMEKNGVTRRTIRKSLEEVMAKYR